MWDSFRAVFYKEWLHIRRDRMTLMMTLMIPMIQMMVYGWLDTNVRHIPTVYCDESRSTESRRFGLERPSPKAASWGLSLPRCCFTKQTASS